MHYIDLYLYVGTINSSRWHIIEPWKFSWGILWSSANQLGVPGCLFARWYSACLIHFVLLCALVCFISRAYCIILTYIFLHAVDNILLTDTLTKTKTRVRCNSTPLHWILNDRERKFLLEFWKLNDIIINNNVRFELWQDYFYFCELCSLPLPDFRTRNPQI